MEKPPRVEGIEKLRKERETFFGEKKRTHKKPEEFIGTTLTLKSGTYVFKKEIGSGFFGEVWEAVREDEDHRPVAVKISRSFERDELYLPEGFDEQFDRSRISSEDLRERARTENVRRLFREAAALKKLGQDPSSPYPHFIDAQFVPSPSRPNARRLVMVMEKIEGENLNDISWEHGFEGSPDAVVRVALQILCAIQYTHDSGFVHRDISPWNLILEKGGRIRVIDLGLVSFREAKQNVTYQRVAPEFDAGSMNFTTANDEPSFAFDVQRDIYAAGKIIGQLLGGKMVIEDETLDPGVFSLPTNDPQRESLLMLAIRMTARNPKERPSVEEAIQNVEEIR
jgi:serine/threonine protein kinase